MSKDVISILVAYHCNDINKWAVVSWANYIDDSEDFDKEALMYLRCCDGSELGDKREIERNLLKLSPNIDDQTFGRELMTYWLEKLKQEKISSLEFVNLLKVMIYDFEDTNDGPICTWAYKVFNEHNGFGFINLEEMSPNRLYELIYSFYE